MNTIRLPAVAMALSALLLACSSEPSPPPTAPAPDPTTRVETRQGEVIGFRADGADVWLGIPYAAPPEGALRWRAPQPPAARSAALEATRFGGVCPQIGSALGGAPDAVSGQLWGTEDCLFLNVYAPSGPRTALPVMLWIHGGGNTVGHSGFYDGKLLAARHDVLVVSINYRLGPLGWLRHPALAGADANDASGNYGTLDIIQALRWTRDNIAAFGGDPTAVTVFGESAGATNVVSLLVSPQATGLFRGAILQSGGTHSASAAAATNYADDPDAPGQASSANELLLRVLRSEADDDPAAAICDRDCARERADTMSLAAQEQALRALGTADLFDLYASDMRLLGPDSPTVIRDGVVLPEEPFIELFGDPQRFNSVPMMLGTNRDEPKIFQAFTPEHVFRLAGLPLWRKNARMYDLRAEYGALAWKLRGVDAPARRLRTNRIPVWTYRWDWDEEGELAFVDLSALLGAAHGLEIPFVFGHWDVGSQSSLIYNEANAEGRIALSERMMAYWAGFARDLDPGTGADGKGPEWRPFAPEDGTTFIRLDTGADGIAMDNEMLDLASLVARLEGDTRFELPAERCAVLESAFGRAYRSSLAAAFERNECAQKPSR